MTRRQPLAAQHQAGRRAAGGAALCLAVVAGALTFPAPSPADSKVSVTGGALFFITEDAGIANALTVEQDARGRVRLFDESDPFGINYPSPPCSPGRVNDGGNPVEVFCERRGFTRMALQMGPGEDRVTTSIDDLPITLEGEGGADVLRTAGGADRISGGQGNDRLDGGAGDDILTGDDADDQLTGGEGNDTLTGGPGTDAPDGGPGDDIIRVADGIVERVACGDGDDTVQADLDDVLVGCEQVERVRVDGASAAAPADTRRPVLQVGGATLQRVSGRARRLAVALSVSEAALVDASGFLTVGGVNVRLRPARARVAVAGGGTVLRVVLTAAQVRRVLADVRRGGRPRARISLSAADAAGNTSAARRFTVRLTRR